MIKTSAPIFVHSDVGRGLVAAKRSGASLKSGSVQDSLMAFLAGQTDLGEAGLLFPAFNYDFGRTRLFNVDNDPVQVGALPEWVRNRRDFRRSGVPFFSFLSKVDLHLDTSGKINPFGENSGFQWLVDQDATLLLFGAGCATLTFVHYVEEMSGKPLYRYDKSFPGEIVQSDRPRGCEFSMHVRPMGVHMDYDWPRLERELLHAGVMRVAEYSADIKWVGARAILEFWGNKMADDPLYLLDQNSLAHFGPATNGGKTRVNLEAYEGG